MASNMSITSAPLAIPAKNSEVMSHYRVTTRNFGLPTTRGFRFLRVFFAIRSSFDGIARKLSHCRTEFSLCSSSRISIRTDTVA